mgnify:CR=1 FL=1
MMHPGKEACDLADRECAPCRGGTEPLKGAALDRWAAKLGVGWQVVDGHHLAKSFAFPDFRQALAFTQQVGELAERVGHHPTIELSWGSVAIRVWTHKIDGLAEADFVFASKVDRLAR